MNSTSEKSIKPITETAYLTAENVKRYRAILRCFFIQYERVKYWMDQDEVYEMVIEEYSFEDYTLEQCKQDLASLVQWKNLIAVQDVKHVNTVEAFKNKQFRYQLSEYGVEIERLTVRLEQLHIEGASLEPTLLERLEKEIERMSEIVSKPALDVHGWWNDIQNDFKRLNQNYQDYMRDLSSAKAEELMKSTEFLMYKDKLIDYLRNFVKNLHLHAGAIEFSLINTPKEVFNQLLEKIVEYELSIPRIEGETDSVLIMQNQRGRLESFISWFVSEGNKISEANRLFDMTNETIRKITRYATQISEQFTMGANRKEEYRKIAEMFDKCRSLTEAHKLSAAVFGVEKPMHLKSEYIRETDSINSGVYEEKPVMVEIKPRIRAFHEKSNRSFIQEHQLEKEAVKKAAIEKQKRENLLVESLIQDGKIVFSSLPVIGEETRNILLRWLSKGLENKDLSGKTESGLEYRILKNTNETNCILHCEDGDFTMPAFEILFNQIS